ncbi:MAG: HdeD family acid-resistance protein [Methylobacteriaceae bacterium]|nr:HdeD family acid-resistance protein [Acetobacteraceae bacterium]MBV9705099.1 HdeD family acid-resistance protein [Methylobacteriaceae bacterium]
MTSTTYSDDGFGGTFGAALARNWWAVEVRGAVAIILGFIALFYTGVTMLSLVYVFAFYAVIDGIFAIISSVRAIAGHQRWGWLLLEGIVDIAAAIFAVMWPGLSIFAFVGIVAGWAIVTGVLELAVAFRLDIDHGRGWLVFAGIASVLYGAVLIWAPVTGAVVLTWWLGAYAIVFGASLMILGFQLKKLVS